MKTLINVYFKVVRFRFPVLTTKLLSNTSELVNCKSFCTTPYRFSDSTKSIWGSKKKHRNVKLQLQQLRDMADPKIEEILAPLRESVKEQVFYVFFSG